MPQHSRCLKWCPAESPPSNTTGGVCRAESDSDAAARPVLAAAPMEEQGSKRKRVHPFEPNMALLAGNFSGEYLAHLLPALAEIGGRRIRSWSGGEEEKDVDMEKMVMFEVNMALAASAGSGFAWSRALRQKLEGGTKVETTHPATAMACTPPLPSTCMKQPWALPPLISRPLAPAGQKYPNMGVRPCSVGVRKGAVLKPRRARRRSSSSKRKLPPREDQKLHGGMRTLRRILPGGEDMGVAQMLSEVGSYVVCLELQVKVLRSLLLGAQERSHY